MTHHDDPIITENFYEFTYKLKFVKGSVILIDDKYFKYNGNLYDDGNGDTKPKYNTGKLVEFPKCFLTKKHDVFMTKKGVLSHNIRNGYLHYLEVSKERDKDIFYKEHTIDQLVIDVYRKYKTSKYGHHDNVRLSNKIAYSLLNDIPLYGIFPNKTSFHSLFYHSYEQAVFDSMTIGVDIQKIY